MAKKLILGFVVASFLGWGAWHFVKSEKSSSSSDLKTLRILTYSSFIAKWGPGPALKENFEQNCHCRVEFVDASEAGALLSRLELKADNKYDLVLGFDQFDVLRALRNFKWQLIQLDTLKFVEGLKDSAVEKRLYAYDWGPLAFVTHKDQKNRPESLDDLLKPEFKKEFILQDPRTSSPGLQFLFWVLAVKGEDAGFLFLEKFSEQIRTLAPSWSTSYGLFQEKVAPFVFSYGTSPLYHLIEEKSDKIDALPFKEGHPVQVEYLGIPETCGECDLATQFVNFIFSPAAQKIIMEKNYMLPSIEGVVEGTPFERVKMIKSLPLASLGLLSKKEEVIERWKKMRRQ